MPLRERRRLLIAIAATAVLLPAAACGGGSSGPSATAGGDVPDGASVTPLPTLDSLIPPLDGPQREPAPTTRTDYRDDPDWQFPRPEELEPPPADAAGAEYSPPEDVQCPESWEVLSRPAEEFEICYPEGWDIAGHGYVSSGEEERWYSVGIVNFAENGKDQLAHVSIYIFPPFSRPVRYTIDCPQPYAVTFAGQDAVICPDFPPTAPEQRLISYNVLFGDADYFINVVSYEGAPEDALSTAIQIAHTYRFLEE